MGEELVDSGHRVSLDSDDHVGEVFLRIDIDVHTTRDEGLIDGEVHSGVVMSDK